MRIIKYTILLFSIVIMNSCSWMDLYPEDQYSIENYWNSKDQVDRFIIGLHNRMRSRQEIFIKMGEFRGGIYDTGLTTPFAQSKLDLNIISNNLSVENPGITSFGNLYMDIMQINHGIHEMSQVKFLSENDKNLNLGILYGMRAFYYFHLFRTYGGVPKIDYPKILDGVDSAGELNTERATEIEIYNFIIDDINKSSEYYKDDNYTISENKSAFWSKAATQLLKAEILLWGVKVKPINGAEVYSKDINKDLNTAKNILLEVKSKYSRVQNYADIFDVKNKDNSEMIFCLRYSATEATNFFNKFLYPEANGNAGGYEYKDGTPVSNADFLNLSNSGSSYNYQISGDTYDYFNEFDSRRNYTFIDLYKTGTEPRQRAVLMTKFLGEIVNGYRRFTNDWPIYRYADVILLLAEVVNELSEDPSDYINEIRLRAYGNKFNSYKYPQGEETAEDAILEERTKEFIAEGKRWYDLRRMKAGKEAIKLQEGNENQKLLHLLWPIDESTLKKDPLLKQTEGY